MEERLDYCRICNSTNIRTIRDDLMGETYVCQDCGQAFVWLTERSFIKVTKWTISPTGEGRLVEEKVL